MQNDTQEFSLKWLFALILTGIIAGVVGIVLTNILHSIQHLVFDSNIHQTQSFRQMVEQSTPMYRLAVLSGCGLVVGVGWWMIHRLGAPLVEIKEIVKHPENSFPFKTTICHSLLQIITVGLGSPLGREVAPREMSVAFIHSLSKPLDLTLAQKQIVLACASGAGLAAVYNVPLAATVFVLETLLLSWRWQLAAAALLSSSVAVWVARLGLGDNIQYHLPQLAPEHIGQALLVWSVLMGVVLFWATEAFNWCMKQLPPIHRQKKQMILWAVVAFALIGVLSMWFPEILGNGKAGNQLAFAGWLDMPQTLGLLVAKWVAVLLALAVGAYGGRITPSMMLGAMIAYASALLWNGYLPEIPATAAAFIGASVFLGIAQNMRLTALIFMLELSRLSTAYWLPLCFCMGSALMTQIFWQKYQSNQSI